MSILKIRQEGDPVLRQVAKPADINSVEVRQLAKDMIETLHAHHGVGLAAPQVGQSIRVIVLTYGKQGPDIALVNPEITKRSGEQTSYEGCLSIREGYRQCKVTRALKVWVEYDDFATGRRETMKFKGLMGCAVQHEIDHLEGKLITDYA